MVLVPFVDALPTVPVAQPVSGSAGNAATYELAIRQFTQKLHRDLPPTILWGFGDGASGGTYPGPTIEATVVHLHGGHVPAEYDGYPEDTLLPGEQTTYVYPNDQLPAAIWYHDHSLGITRLNVYMGLAGLYVLRDSFEAALGLPSAANEIPLLIQDRTFRADGSLVYPAAWQEHFFGDTILVNGKVWLFLSVKQGKYRFRVINGSGSRAYTLSLSNDASFVQIGTDGGLLPAPVTVSTITLMPAERADIVVDFQAYAAGTEIVLENGAEAPFGGMAHDHAGALTAATSQVMKFIVSDQAGYTADVPASLRDPTPVPGPHG